MAKKHDEKKQPPPPFPPSSKAKKQEKQPPSSPLAPSLSTKSLAKLATTGTKQEKQLPPILPNFPLDSSSESLSESSSDADESLPPASSLFEKLAGASTSTVLPKHPEHSDSTVGEVEEEDEDSETDNESKEEESSDDTTPLVAKPNPPPLLQPSQEGKGKQTSSSTSSSGSYSEDGESEEVDSSSESDQPQPPPLHKHAENIAMKAEAPIAENDSDHDNSSPRKSPLSSVPPLSSKQLDRPAQPVDKSGIIESTPSSNTDSKKKRKRANDNTEEAGQEKNIPFKKIWSDEDELALLRGILGYKERYHVVPSSLVQLNPLHASIKGSMSIPVSLNQMHQKVRRMMEKYNTQANRINGSMTPPTLNAHAAAVFDLSKKIWGSSKGESFVSKKKIKVEKMKDIKNVKVKEKQFPMGYPCLHRFIKHEHPNIPSVLRFNHIPNNKSDELEEKCEKLEIAEVRLHIKTQGLLHSALELIDVALSKRG